MNEIELLQAILDDIVVLQEEFGFIIAGFFAIIVILIFKK